MASLRHPVSPELLAIIAKAMGEPTPTMYFDDFFPFRAYEKPTISENRTRATGRTEYTIRMPVHLPRVRYAKPVFDIETYGMNSPPRFFGGDLTAIEDRVLLHALSMSLHSSGVNMRGRRGHDDTKTDPLVGLDNKGGWWSKVLRHVV